MLFNSCSFLVFFALVLILHSLPLSWRVRKFNLLVASYVFYAAWNPPFVLLLWFSTVLDWQVAKYLDRVQSVPARRVLLAISLAGNLGVLAYFKYGAFLLENFVAFTHALGIPFHPARPDIILPVGISFYTFQTLSYSLDVYQRKAHAWKSFLDFSLFVTFFPQLVAGPILRATDFLPQCLTPRRATGDQLGLGLFLALLGLFQKIVLADALLAPVVEIVYNTPAQPGFLSAWVATLAFAGQIFCDFAGYSTCAIGVALCLGFHICDNFRYPYAAVGFSNFWQRWHISLSSWLRDYLYIPLGGNRKGTTRTYVNLMATMLLGGLWHGASYTFVAWGGLHGFYLCVERLFRNSRIAKAFQSARGMMILGALLTFAAVNIAWVFFRAQSFGQAFDIIAAMLGLGGMADPAAYVPPRDKQITLAVMLGMLLVHWHMRDRELKKVVLSWPGWARSGMIAVFIVSIALLSSEMDRAFIYFQF